MRRLVLGSVMVFAGRGFVVTVRHGHTDAVAAGRLMLSSSADVAQTVKTLLALPGVGPVTAQKILAWRAAHGRFRSPAELQEIDGIGPKSYAEIAPHVRV
mgnify:CR=1 FL=1